MDGAADPSEGVAAIDLDAIHPDTHVVPLFEHFIVLGFPSDPEQVSVQGSRYPAGHSDTANEAPKAVFEPVILDRYPRPDLEADGLGRPSGDEFFRYPLPDQVAMFALPNGVMLYTSPVPSTPIQYTMRMTDGEGNPLYVSCLAFSDLVDPSLLGGLDLAATDPETGDELPQFSEKCLCLLSREPRLDLMSRVLRLLYRRAQHEDSVPLENDIAHLFRIPAPSPTCSVLFRVCQRPLLAPCTANRSWYPLMDIDVRAVFQSLSWTTIAPLFSALLLEWRVVLLSTQLSTLHRTAEALTQLLHPFQWPHIFVPILPANQIEYISAPVPFLMGLKKDLIEDDDALREVTVVDLDCDTISSPQPIPALAHAEFLHRLLLTAMHPRLDNMDVVVEDEDDQDGGYLYRDGSGSGRGRTRSVPPITTTTTTTTTTTDDDDDDNAVIAGVEGGNAGGGRGPPGLIVDPDIASTSVARATKKVFPPAPSDHPDIARLRIQAAFMSWFVLVFHKFRTYVDILQEDPERDLIILFNKPTFLNERFHGRPDSQDKHFLAKMLETQMFASFLELYHNPRPERNSFDLLLQQTSNMRELELQPFLRASASSVSMPVAQEVYRHVHNQCYRNEFDLYIVPDARFYCRPDAIDTLDPSVTSFAYPTERFPSALLSVFLPDDPPIPDALPAYRHEAFADEIDHSDGSRLRARSQSLRHLDVDIRIASDPTDAPDSGANGMPFSPGEGGDPSTPGGSGAGTAGEGGAAGEGQDPSGAGSTPAQPKMGWRERRKSIKQSRLAEKEEQDAELVAFFVSCIHRAWEGLDETFDLRKQVILSADDVDRLQRVHKQSRCRLLFAQLLRDFNAPPRLSYTAFDAVAFITRICLERVSDENDFETAHILLEPLLKLHRQTPSHNQFLCTMFLDMKIWSQMKLWRKEFQSALEKKRDAADGIQHKRGVDPDDIDHDAHLVFSVLGSQVYTMNMLGVSQEKLLKFVGSCSRKYNLTEEHRVTLSTLVNKVHLATSLMDSHHSAPPHHEAGHGMGQWQGDDSPLDPMAEDRAAAAAAAAAIAAQHPDMRSGGVRVGGPALATLSGTANGSGSGHETIVVEQAPVPTPARPLTSTTTSNNTSATRNTTTHSQDPWGQAQGTTVHSGRGSTRSPKSPSNPNSVLFSPPTSSRNFNPTPKVWSGGNVITPQPATETSLHRPMADLNQCMPSTVLVSGSCDGSVRIWNIDEIFGKGRYDSKRSTHQLLEGHTGWVSCLATSPHQIASGSYDRSARLWDMQTSQCTGILTDHNASILCIELEDNFVITGSYDKRVRLYDIRAPRSQSITLDHATGPVTCLDIDSTSHGLVTGSRDAAVRVYDLRQPSVCVRTLNGHSDWIKTIYVDSNVIMSGSYDKCVCVWDRTSDDLISKLSNHPGTVNSFCLVEDTLYTAAGATACMWDVVDGSLLSSLQGHKDEVSGIAVHDTGRWVVTGSFDHSLKVWDSMNGSEISTLSGHAGWVYCMELYTNVVASGSRDATVKLWDIYDGRCITTLQGHTGAVNCLRWQELQ